VKALLHGLYYTQLSFLGRGFIVGQP